jgi:hypothetical protein
MALRRRLASLLTGGLLLTALGLTTAPPMRADDPICATKPDQCVTMTVRVSGYLDGHGFDQAGTTVDCHHDASTTTTTCTWAFGVTTSRVVTMTVQADNPAGATVCNGTQCGPSPQSKDYTLTSGQRGPTVTMTINPTDGKTITVSKGGTGTGTITSDKGGISCGSACSWMYAPSTLVVLTASPTGSSTFVGWSDGGTCQGQDETCHVLTNVNVTTQAVFNLPATPQPPASPAATSSATATPAATASPKASSAPKTPGPSTGATFKPPTLLPGTPPPGATQDPTATLLDIPSFDPSADPNAAPTPTPFKFQTDDPLRTAGPIGAVPTAPPTQPAGDTGAGPPWLVIGLVVLLGVVVGGGVFWWARRRGVAPG